MPSRKTTRKAKEDLREGSSASTAAGEFVHEEMHHKQQGKHGRESRKQAIAIGLSKARRAGIPIRKRPSRKASTRRSPIRRSSTRRSATRRSPTRARSRSTRRRIVR